MNQVQQDTERESVEIALLAEALYRQYGYDFREYAYASLKRRVRNVVQSEGLTTITSLQDRLLHDSAAFQRFLLAVSVNVTSMFRDPGFFRTVRERLAPLLRTYPFIRIWHAGCSTGEEVYSMAILLQEEGLHDRCRIYATDMDEAVLKQARDGIFPLRSVRSYEHNYDAAGGKGRLEDYYTAAYGSAMFSASLRDNIVFSQHNLAQDRSFNEFNAIFCRNVLIYFNRSLQNRVHNLFHESLAMFGMLALGSKETLQFTPHERDYEQLGAGCKIYRRVR